MRWINAQYCRPSGQDLLWSSGGLAKENDDDLFIHDIFTILLQADLWGMHAAILKRKLPLSLSPSVCLIARCSSLGP